MTRGLGLLVALALLAVSTARAADPVRVVPIVRDDTVVVSAELVDAIGDDVRQAIASGLRTTFTYDVELRMHVPAWVDHTVATIVVSVSDQYDNLTRRHTLSRTVDGRVAETLVTESDAVVSRWLSTVERLPLCPTSKLDASRDYYVRVSARARPHGASMLGWASAVTGQARFTFIP